MKIRPVTKKDIQNLKAVIDSIELFPSELLDEMLEGYFTKKEECIWLTSEANEPTFVAYCAPEQMTEGTWNLYLIAVHKEIQGKGMGKKIMAYIENILREKGGRILIVETSGSPEFQQTRDFYHKCNYEEEARIRDFYQAGEDKIIFWKLLNNKS